VIGSGVAQPLRRYAQQRIALNDDCCPLSRSALDVQIRLIMSMMLTAISEIERAASAWIARRNTLQSAEASQSEFEDWLAADPSHAEVFREMYFIRRLRLTGQSGLTLKVFKEAAHAAKDAVRPRKHLPN
jgi:hypothetical protein